jgi:hypothetical protein
VAPVGEVMVPVGEVMVPVGEVIVPRLSSMDAVNDLHRMCPVSLRRAGCASLDRPDKREHEGKGDGEQQYEKADWPHEKGELPSMGATVAECGRSLSASGRTSAQGNEARVTRMGQSAQLPAD